MGERCKLCKRRLEEDSEFCTYHLRAYTGLQEAFRQWRKALDIDWNGFLIEVSGNPGTGEWAREVANDLLLGLRYKASESHPV